MPKYQISEFDMRHVIENKIIHKTHQQDYTKKHQKLGTYQIYNSNRFLEGETKLFIPYRIKTTVDNLSFCCLLQEILISHFDNFYCTINDNMQSHMKS